MIFVKARRVIQSGFNNFWRSPAVSLASVFTMLVTLFVIGALLLSNAFLNATLQTIQDQVDISVTFNPDAAETDVLALKESLTLLPEVTEVEYLSREQELASFRERHQDNSLIIQSLEEVGNPFGARLNIKAANPSQYETIAGFLEARGGEEGSSQLIDKVSFKKDVVDKLLRVINSTQRVGFAVTLVLVIISILVTINTISLAIYTSREEISVMRLVGASALYVRGPFMVEGVIAGLIAAIGAVILLYPATIWVRNATTNVYGGINLVAYYVDNFTQIFLILLGSGILLGVIASYLAVRKYVKV
ncbi:MAG: ABC transporter permease [Candidatus Pacebacteria bacterium]|nr:ABC transporter permease [Candidatus Paceibacterota bacterium]